MHKVIYKDNNKMMPFSNIESRKFYIVKKSSQDTYTGDLLYCTGQGHVLDFSKEYSPWVSVDTSDMMICEVEVELHIVREL